MDFRTDAETFLQRCEGAYKKPVYAAIDRYEYYHHASRAHVANFLGEFRRIFLYILRDIRTY